MSRPPRSVAPPSSWFIALAAALLFLGVYFRLAHVERRPVRFDEVMTALLLSGHAQADLVPALAGAGPIPIEALAPFKAVQPDLGMRGITAILAATNPHQTPLFGALAWAWARDAGDAITSVRRLAAAISLLSLPLMLWLGWEVFGEWRAAWIAAALLAVSPLHVLYAQEARTYSLWTVAVLLASATLLRATRRQTAGAWCLYAAAVALALYAQLFSLVVVAGHGLWVLVTRVAARPHRVPLYRDRTVRAYALATLAGGALFAPWLINLVRHREVAYSMTEWVQDRPLFLPYIKTIALNFAATLLDTRMVEGNTLYYLSLPVVAFMAFVLWRIARAGPPRAGLFLLASIVPLLLALGVPDLLSGGVRLSVVRYTIPAILALQLALAGWFAGHAGPPTSSDAPPFGKGGPGRISSADPSDKSPSIPLFQRGKAEAIWRNAGLALALAAGVLSCAVQVRASSWWTKSGDRYSWDVARAVGASPRPLLISDSPGALLVISAAVPRRAHVLLASADRLPEIPAGFSDVFVSLSFFQHTPALAEQTQCDAAPIRDGANWARLVPGPGRPCPLARMP